MAVQLHDIDPKQAFKASRGLEGINDAIGLDTHDRDTFFEQRRSSNLQSKLGRTGMINSSAAMCW